MLQITFVSGSSGYVPRGLIKLINPEEYVFYCFKSQKYNNDDTEMYHSQHL